MIEREEEYLGDGLYVRYDGGMIRLRAPRDNGDHVVYLDDWGFRNFIEWCERVPGWSVDQHGRIVTRRD